MPLWNVVRTLPRGLAVPSDDRLTVRLSSSRSFIAARIRELQALAIGAEWQWIRRPRFLAEVERREQGSRLSVAVRELRQSPVVLHEPENARELAELVRHEAALRVRRDDEQRHADPEPEVVALGWRDVVVDPAVVVPGDEDGGVLPVWALHDGVHDPRRPVLAVAHAVLGVLGHLEPRRHPRHRREQAPPRVPDEPGDGGEVFGPVLLVLADVANGVVRRPDVAVLVLRRRVVRPRDPGVGQQVALGQKVEAWRHAFLDALA